MNNPTNNGVQANVNELAALPAISNNKPDTPTVSMKVENQNNQEEGQKTDTDSPKLRRKILNRKQDAKRRETLDTSINTSVKSPPSILRNNSAKSVDLKKKIVSTSDDFTIDKKPTSVIKNKVLNKSLNNSDSEPDPSSKAKALERKDSTKKLILAFEGVGKMPSSNTSTLKVMKTPTLSTSPTNSSTPTNILFQPIYSLNPPIQHTTTTNSTSPPNTPERRPSLSSPTPTLTPPQPFLMSPRSISPRNSPRTHTIIQSTSKERIEPPQDTPADHPSPAQPSDALLDAKDERIAASITQSKKPKLQDIILNIVSLEQLVNNENIPLQSVYSLVNVADLSEAGLLLLKSAICKEVGIVEINNLNNAVKSIVESLRTLFSIVNKFSQLFDVELGREIKAHAITLQTATRSIIASVKELNNNGNNENCKATLLEATKHYIVIIYKFQKYCEMASNEYLEATLFTCRDLLDSLIQAALSNNLISTDEYSISLASSILKVLPLSFLSLFSLLSPFLF